jgi:hypothetical protein
MAGTAPLEYRITLLLVAIPFNIGIMLATRDFVARFVGFFHLIDSIKFVIDLKSELPESPTANLGLLTMYALWIVVGFVSTYIMIAFISVVGPSGFVYLLGLTSTGVGLSAAIIDPTVMRYQDRDWQDILLQLEINGTLILLGIIAFSLFGKHQVISGVRRSSRVVIRTFLSFAVLGFLTNYFWQQTLSDLLWLVPGMRPPVVYNGCFGIIMALVAMPSQTLARKGDIF